MSFKKLIVSGCSYTSYSYKTWADHLGASFPIYRNLGKSGSGPRYSFIKISDYFEYDIWDSTVLPQDTAVVVQWSSLLRNDMILSTGDYPYKWSGGGQVNNNARYNSEYLKNHFNVTDKAADLVYYIKSLTELSERLGFKLLMMYMFEPFLSNLFGEPTAPMPETTRYQDQYFNSPYYRTLEEVTLTNYWVNPSIEMFALDNPDPAKDPKESHPSSKQHYEYAKIVAKKLGVNLKSTI